MSGQAAHLLAEEHLPFPPKVEDFYLPDFFTGSTTTFWATKVTTMVVLSVVLIVAFFLYANRRPQLVPTKRQWIAESVYGFARNNIGVNLIGEEGVRYAPYLATLMCFLLVNNLWGIIPLFQLSPMSHIAFPAFLALISWVLFNWVGIRKHGFATYMKHTLIPPAPWFILPLLIPIEFVSTLVFRPLTLALRLFANMFAGHVILLVFTVGGFAMINANGLLFPVSVLSWALTVVLTLLEAFIGVLQAYLFTVLTASYIQGALAEGH